MSRCYRMLLTVVIAGILGVTVSWLLVKSFSNSKENEPATLSEEVSSEKQRDDYDLVTELINKDLEINKFLFSNKPATTNETIGFEGETYTKMLEPKFKSIEDLKNRCLEIYSDPQLVKFYTKYSVDNHSLILEQNNSMYCCLDKWQENIIPTPKTEISREEIEFANIEGNSATVYVHSEELGQFGYVVEKTENEWKINSQYGLNFSTMMNNQYIEKQAN